jgi:flagellar biosynthesis/type III secretory pathway chaperone
MEAADMAQLIPNSVWTGLNTTFEQDLPATAQLLALLQRERETLEARNYQEFQTIIDHKQKLLSLLEHHTGIRQQLLQQAGLVDEASTLKAAHQQAPAVAESWQKLGKQWARCQELNEINERIAQRTRLVVGQVLDLLRGQNKQEKLYDVRGYTNNSNSGRSITSA